MADKKKLPTLISPRGTLKYPRVSGEADFRYKKDEGEFHTKVLFDPNDTQVQAFLKKLDTAADEAVAVMREENPKYKKTMQRVAPYVMEVDKEGEETGLIEFKVSKPFKVTAKKGKNAGKTYEFRPALFDAKGNALAKDLRVGGGTEAKVSFEYAPYFNATDKKAGITRRLIAVQIIKLVEWNSSRDASDFGFEEEEGYSSLEDADTSSVSTGVADESDDETETGNAGDF